MLKKHQLRQMALDGGGEHVLGLKDLNTHACYMIYGELEPGENSRKICPGSGHEEILIAVKGDIEVTGEPFNGLLSEGEALHFKDEETCTIANPGDVKAIYVMAGGHSGKEH